MSSSSFIFHSTSSFLKSRSSTYTSSVTGSCTNTATRIPFLYHSNCNGHNFFNDNRHHYLHSNQTNLVRPFSALSTACICTTTGATGSFSSKTNKHHTSNHYSTPSSASSSSLAMMSSSPVPNHQDLDDNNIISSPLSPSYIKPHTPSDKVIEVKILSYLSSIEHELQSIQNQTFQVKIRPQNCRPMIRTLLGIPSKDEFYQLCRITRNQLEYKKMLDFVILFKEEVLKKYDLEYVQQKLPYFQSSFFNNDDNYNIASAEESKKSSSSEYWNYIQSSKRGVQYFSRLASGREYKGKFIDMVEDLTPHLVHECNEAMIPLTDAQVLLEVIEKIDAASTATSSTSSSSSSSSSMISKERIQAAKGCVVDLLDFSSNGHNHSDATDDETNNNNGNGNLPKLNGLECEQACISYLEGERQYYHDYNDCTNDENSNINRQFILQNVVINHKSTQNRSKYSDGNMRNSQGGWKKHIIDDDTTTDHNGDGDENANNNESQSKPTITSTGIIWTSNQGGRENICSEFDALKVHQLSDTYCTISEFWEAKYLVSPSSLHDAITKKLSSIRSVVEDEDGMISYNGSHYTLKARSEDQGAITFGLFGMELLSSQNAIGQLRSTAASFALTNFVDVALQAAETGYVEVKVDHLLEQLIRLKKVFEQTKDFEIILKIVK